MSTPSLFPFPFIPLVAVAIPLVFLGCSNSGSPPSSHADHASHDGAHAGHSGMHMDTDSASVTDSILMVRTEPPIVKPTEEVKLNLMIHEASGAMVSRFETVHEKKLHLIIVNEGLDQFAHIHPEIDSMGNITAAYAFPTSGKYRLYADHKPVGKAQSVAMGDLTVTGKAVAPSPLFPNVPGKIKSGIHEANIDVENPKSGEMTIISFSIFDAVSGKPVTDLQPYLGAMGHLVVLSTDGKKFVHSHPVDGGSAKGPIVFGAHFPSPGVYKGWGQFQRSGTVHDLPFVIKVD